MVGSFRQWFHWKRTISSESRRMIRPFVPGEGDRPDRDRSRIMAGWLAVLECLFLRTDGGDGVLAPLPSVGLHWCGGR